MTVTGLILPAPYVPPAPKTYQPAPGSYLPGWHGTGRPYTAPGIPNSGGIKPVIPSQLGDKLNPYGVFPSPGQISSPGPPEINEVPPGQWLLWTIDTTSDSNANQGIVGGGTGAKTLSAVFVIPSGGTFRAQYAGTAGYRRYRYNYGYRIGTTDTWLGDYFLDWGDDAAAKAATDPELPEEFAPYAPTTWAPSDRTPLKVPTSRPSTAPRLNDDRKAPYAPGFRPYSGPESEEVNPPIENLEPGEPSPLIPDYPPPLPDAPSRRRRIFPKPPLPLPEVQPDTLIPIGPELPGLLEEVAEEIEKIPRRVNPSDCCAIPEVRRQHERTRKRIKDLEDEFDCPDPCPEIAVTGSIATAFCDGNGNPGLDLAYFTDLPNAFTLLSQEIANLRFDVGLCQIDPSDVTPFVIASGTSTDGDAVQYVNIQDETRHVELIITGTIPNSVRTMRNWGNDEQQAKYGLISVSYPGVTGGNTNERMNNFAWTRRTGLYVGTPKKPGRAVRVFLKPGLSWVLYDTGLREI